MDLHIKIIGCLLVIISLLHLFFPKYFEWKKECSSMSQINRQMFYIHSYFIALVLFLMGVLCLTSAFDLLNTNLGKRISLGFALFWITRLVVQFVGYSSKLWKGKRFETGIHIIFSLFWIYFSTVFLLIYFS
jgi:hypothetical protein